MSRASLAGQRAAGAGPQVAACRPPLYLLVALQSFQRTRPMAASGRTPGRACAGADGPAGPSTRRHAGVLRLVHGCQWEDPWQGMRGG